MQCPQEYSKKVKREMQLERLEVMQCRLDLMFAKIIQQKNKNCYVVRYAKWSKHLPSTPRAYCFLTNDSKSSFIPRAVVFEHYEPRAIMVIGAYFIDSNRSGASRDDMLQRLHSISVPGGVLCPR